MGVEEAIMPRRPWRSARPLLLLCLVWLAAAMVVALADKKSDRKAEKTEAPALRLLGEGEHVRGGPLEPSGIVFHPRLGRLFAVGDEGSVVELDPSGRALHIAMVGGNLEDVAVHPNGSLLLLAENSAELILYDAESRKETRRWTLDTSALLGEKPAAKAHGFEGLAFRADSGAPGGAWLYLVHQRGPAMVVAMAFDPSRAPGPLGADAVKARWKIEGHQDVTAATYVPSLDRLLVIADAEDRILVLGLDGRVQAEIVLPGLQQEGLCFDSKGTLWVADDRAGQVVRYPGALAALTVGLRPDRAAAQPARER